MDNQVTTTITGIRASNEALRQLEFAARRRVVSAAIRAGASVVQDAARQRAPVGLTGNLRRQLRTSVKMDRSTGTVSATIAGRATKANKAKGQVAWYTRLVIGGTKPHMIRPVLAGGLSIGDGVYGSALHPGAKPNPFMEQAADSVAAAAVQAFDARFFEKMEEEIARTAAAVRGVG